MTNYRSGHRANARIRLLAVLAGVGLLATGCSGAPQGESTSDGAEPPKPASLVFPTFGGAYQDATMATLVPCFEDATGIKVELMTGSTPEWLAKVKADPGNPPVQVILGTGGGTYQALDSGLLRKLDPTKIPNLVDIPSNFKDANDGYSVTFDGGSWGISFNKDKVPNPPSSWKEFVDGTISGKYGDKVGILSMSNPTGPQMMIWLTTQAYGKSFDQSGIDFAFSKIKEMLPNVSAVSQTITDEGTLLTSGEVDLIPWNDGRTFALVDGGASNLDFVRMSEGAPATTVELLVPENASPYVDEFINCSLDPKVQAEFAAFFPGYFMTNEKIVYPDKVKDRVPETSQLLFPPQQEISDLIPSLLARWNTEIGR